VLDLDLLHVAVLVGHHGVEGLRPVDREQQERQHVVGQGGEAVLGEPDGVGQADQHLLVGRTSVQARKIASHRPPALGCTT
jgi:hypothetical protein